MVPQMEETVNPKRYEATKESDAGESVSHVRITSELCRLMNLRTLVAVSESQVHFKYAKKSYEFCMVPVQDLNPQRSSTEPTQQQLAERIIC
jgi:hypothetical protein